TPTGFFAASPEGLNMLSIVRGLEVTSIAQLYDHLYRPELVEEMLRVPSDPEGKHKNEAFKLNLEKIMDSGPAPQLEFLEKKTEQAGDTVRLTVRINGTGGGIGEKLVWRLGNVTQGRPFPTELKGLALGPLSAATVTETLIVDPGKINTIEVTAYNGAGLLAT